MPAVRTLSKSSARKTAEPATASARPSTKGAQPDAIQLLKDDHRQVEAWFEQFENAKGDSRKAALAQKICLALTVHAQIEEEIFYPAYLEATGDDDMHDEAHVEHDGAKKLIAEIEAGSPGQDMWDAKVTVLSEMIKHHVKEEEQRDGMFARAKKSGMDLQEIGLLLAQRKKELMAAAR